ncbi:PE family protein [Mycobacterium kubicae]|uniref:PE family protein n=1 Tax=Mycobacterium kubicae TaxID=120959 RepID=A0ABQ1BPV1_9MYCO|nr:PE family protein [Mycobacterium kubicae]GFG65736.1 PE family protein [Mycobacterium kubicae]
MAVSFLATTPQLVTAAAENLAGLGSNLGQATAAAARGTTGVAAAAADEVSLAIAQVFGSFGEEFQAVNAQAAAFHSEFVRLLNGSAAAYVATEIANAQQNVMSAVNAPAQTLLSGVAASPAAAAADILIPGAYQRLIVNTVTNLQALGNAWGADPFPFLRQFLANQLGYGQQIATGFASTFQNAPLLLANLPATIQANIQTLANFPAAFYAQQFITTQIGFAQAFANAVSDGIATLLPGLPAFGAGLQQAFGTLLTGNYYGAVVDVARAYANLLVTGFDPGNVTFGTAGFATITATVNPRLLGPLGDLFTIMNLPGQEAQFLTSLMPPSIPRQIAQNFTNVLNTLTNPSISATLALPLTNLAGGSLSAFFGLPLVAAYASAGAPFSALGALALSATNIEQALASGNLLGALGAFIDAPAATLDGFLNAQTLVTQSIVLPNNLPIGPPSISIDLHLPFDGLLVPPHPVTATVHVPSFPVLGIPTLATDFDVPIFGTPFSGLIPLLVNYIPQQLAHAITPAA